MVDEAKNSTNNRKCDNNFKQNEYESLFLPWNKIFKKLTFFSQLRLRISKIFNYKLVVSSFHLTNDFEF